ncbi:hypothetical protein LTR04_005693 [Oleoguttula sp. CCFEE 6159]|nr:hypothetical protein LTR04_005693 [Oleoguttula sp. CCFEE 6159]
MDAFMDEDNPHAPLRLLSLDGGGVRGLSSLMVLDDLMENIAQEEKRLKKRDRFDNTPLKPCDYFDLIGGTSTGGIIAVLLGRLRLDCRQCIEIYTQLAKDIFEKDRSFRIAGLRVPIGNTRFRGATLERAIKNALVKLGFDANELMWDDSLFEQVRETGVQRDSIWADDVPEVLTESPTQSPKDSLNNSKEELAPAHPEEVEELAKSGNGQLGNGTLENSSDTLYPKQHSYKPTWRVQHRSSVHKRANQKGCRAFVVSALKNALGLPRIFATYDPNDHSTRIWEALRATTAAPTFFEEMTFGTPRMTYLDGGLGYNSPCAEVDYAAKSIWQGRPIGIIVSVGTGLATIPSVKKVASWLPFGLGLDIALASALASMATGTARVDNEMQRMYYGTATKYYRFDVDGGLANVSLEQWMKEDQMAALTEQYMRDPQQLKRARHLGELVVKLSALPPRFEIGASQFKVGMSGRGVVDGGFVNEELDFKTGWPLGATASAENVAGMSQARSTSPSGEGGLVVDTSGRLRQIYPVARDLDGDGRREEAIVTTCLRADNVCLRALRTGVPPGDYRVEFVVCFFDSTPTLGDVVAPSELIFSVGKPYDSTTFLQRHVDVRITPDVVPVLLHPDAVRARVGRTRHKQKKGKGWVEIEGDLEVAVGLDGALGLVVSKSFREGEFLGGWSFGGVRLKPVFGKARGRA